MFMIIGAIIGYIVGWYNTESKGIGICGGIVGVITGFLIWFIFPASWLPTVETVETKEIYALIDTSETEGSHYLFSGYINEDLVYRYVIATDKGRKVETIKASKAYLKEGTALPKIEIYTTEFDGRWCGWVSAGLGLMGSEYAIIYIPKNSITTEYNVDLN